MLSAQENPQLSRTERREQEMLGSQRCPLQSRDPTPRNGVCYIQSGSALKHLKKHELCLLIHLRYLEKGAGRAFNSHL